MIEFYVIFYKNKKIIALEILVFELYILYDAIELNRGANSNSYYLSLVNWFLISKLVYYVMFSILKIIVERWFAEISVTRITKYV